MNPSEAWPRAPAPPGAPRPTIVAVVVTFQRREALGLTLIRLLAEPLDRVVVVDNGSTDGSRDWLAGLDDPRLTVLLPAVNLGGAGGFELGMRTAVARFDPDWILLMDDDARPEPGALAAFRRLDCTGWDAICAAVRYPDGAICEMNRPSFNPFRSARRFLATLTGAGRMGYHLEDAAYGADRLTPVDGASFVGLFLSRDAVARAGYPDGRLFIYGDDVLYTHALSRAGGRIGFAPQIRFEHDCATLERGDRAFRPVWKAYYHHRNLLFVYRSMAGPLFWPILLLILPRWRMRARAYGDQAGRFRHLLGLAIRDGIAGRRDRSHDEIRALADPG